MHTQRVMSLVVLLSLAGCEGMNKQVMGAGIGATACGVAGGFLARAAGLSQGASVGIGLLSAGACGWAGSELGKYLDEQDRKKHQEAVAKALETGESQAWTSPQSGTSGQIQVKEISPPKPQAQAASETPASAVTTTQAGPVPAPTVVSAPQGRICRTVSQTIKLKDGTTKSEELTACKGPNGWEAA